MPHRLFRLLTVVWVGSLLTIGYAVAPVLFTSLDRMTAGGFSLLDVQWLTPHLATFGAVEIPRTQYLRQLRRALLTDATF